VNRTLRDLRKSVDFDRKQVSTSPVSGLPL
jgi:hypothetical protein